MVAAVATPTRIDLAAYHYKQCVEQRGLNPQWILANCRSVSVTEATLRLGYTAQSGGIWLEDCNHQSQYRPDKPWLSEKDRLEGKKKAPKYRSPLGEYDAMLPRHPTDPHYWTDIVALKQKAFQIDGHPCLLLTEGFFKAIAGCSHSIPAIALLGVEMGLTSSGADVQGKRYLVPTLERYARAGFGFIIGFDADCATNGNVIQAQRKLAHQLTLFKVPVYSVTGLWTVAEGKGMDDYIQNHGAERFKREVMGKAVDIAAWEKQFQSSTFLPTGKLPPADIVAHEIAEQYKDQLAFNNEIGRWMRYGADCPGMWSLETDEYIEAIVGGILDGQNITGYGSYSYLTNVIKTLRRLLIVRQWLEKTPKELLPFTNGVLEVSTGQLLPHSPGYRLTWQLPRNHDPNATDWSTIDAYLDHLSGGKAAIKEMLMCFCNAVLTGRSDLHKFLHLIGLAGSGKGTFARLLTDLIGADNIYSGTLEDWCSNRFESANAHRKRLVVFWDEDKQTGKLGKFLSLTGGDWIRAEEKGKKAFQYRYDGMVVVCSNLPIFTGVAASRIARRVVTVPCNHSVPARQRRDLNREFAAELDAFTNHVLSIPDAHVTKVLMGLADIPECTLEFWENRIRTDSIAAWINDWVIFDVLAETAIGSDKNEWEKGTPLTLYGSYALHCKQSGTQPKANKNFSPDLLELCRSVLDWEVERKVTKIGKFIKGLRLRTDADFNISTHDYLLIQKVMGGDRSGDGSGDGSERLQAKVFIESDGSTQTSSENRQFELGGEMKLDLNEEVEGYPSPAPNLLESVTSEESPPTVTQPIINANSAPPEAIQVNPAQSQALAALILSCQTWTAIAKSVNQDGNKLKQAAAQMTPEQRRGLSQVLAAHLCANADGLNQLVWVPIKLTNRALERLSFTLQRIGSGMLDANVEDVAGCQFVTVEHLGTRRELWIFKLPNGKNIAAGIDTIQSIELLPT